MSFILKVLTPVAIYIGRFHFTGFHYTVIIRTYYEIMLHADLLAHFQFLVWSGISRRYIELIFTNKWNVSGLTNTVKHLNKGQALSI